MELSQVFAQDAKALHSDRQTGVHCLWSCGKCAFSDVLFLALMITKRIVDEDGDKDGDGDGCDGVIGCWQRACVLISVPNI